MLFDPLILAGAFVIRLEPRGDERGMFARTYCAKEFGDRGLATRLVQCSLSVTAKKGTIRGLHFQRPPAAEVKIVRCTAGAIHDVIVDLRERSTTRWQHVGVELSAMNRLALYVPEGFAHGFQTLTDQVEVQYQMSEYYSPENAGGLRFDDPRLGIRWPLEVTEISEKDRGWPLL